MSKDERPPSVRAIEVREEFIQHVEAGSSKIRVISVVSIIVAALLAVSYAYQLSLPIATGTRYVQVDLANPSLVALQIFLFALVIAWLFVGTREYLFTRRLTKQIKEIRQLEHDLISGSGLSE